MIDDGLIFDYFFHPSSIISIHAEERRELIVTMLPKLPRNRFQPTNARMKPRRLITCLITGWFVGNSSGFHSTSGISSPSINKRGEKVSSVVFLSNRQRRDKWRCRELTISFFSFKNYVARNETTLTSASKGSTTPNNNLVPIESLEESDATMLYTMMALIFTVASLSALDRVAMSIALVPIGAEMGYSDTVKGEISSLFSVGYAIGILPCGLLLPYASPRLVIATGVLLWSMATVATPFAADEANMGPLLFCRAVVGGAESVVIPSVQKLVSNWVPPEKKSLAIAILFAGLNFGTFSAYILSPPVILLLGGWRSLFYVYGGIGLLFLIPWLGVAKDVPRSMEVEIEIPKVMRERDEASSSFPALQQAKNVLTSAPWSGFIQSKGVWAMMLAHAANNWGLYISLAWGPTFYQEQYGLDVRESALLLVVPSIAGALGGLLAGSVADAVIQNLEETDDNVTLARRVFQGISLYGAALCLLILSLNIPEEPWVAQSLLTGAVGFKAFSAAGYGAANQEKAGAKWTGLLYSITSLPAVMVGTCGVYVTGRILDSTNQDWSFVFGLNAAIYVLGATAFAALYESKREFD
jgi:ACS family sodium-dependent inorganic phosphate cotransporter